MDNIFILQTIIKTFGVSGEIAWAIMILLTWFGPENPRKWFKKHKKISNIIMVFVIFGWLYFMYQMMFKGGFR